MLIKGYEISSPSLSCPACVVIAFTFINLADAPIQTDFREYNKSNLCIYSI